MAQVMYFDCRKVLLFSVLLFIFVSVCYSACSEQLELYSSGRGSSRRILEAEKEEQEKPLKRKTTSTNTSQSTKNQTKLIKPNNSLSSKNQTKTIKSDNISTKNQTKSIKPNNISTKNQTNSIKSSNISTKNQTKAIKSSNISNKNQTKTIKSDNLSSKNQTKLVKLRSTNSSSKITPTDTGLKKSNSTTSTSKIKKLNSTSKASPNSSKPSSISTSSKKSLDLVKASNKTTKATATTKDKDKDKEKQTKTTNKVDQIHEPDKPNKKTQKPSPNQQHNKKPTTKQAPPSWFVEEEEEDDDLVSEFRDLPNKFHQTLIPDLEKISTSSKAYITKANNEMTEGFKPYVGKKYAPTIATIVSCAFILIPLLLVSLLCNRIKAYFSLQKILIFIQVYLSIYFTILCISSLVTGLEPLKFLYSTSPNTYLCLQVLQTLAYVLYLLLLLMYLVLVFSTEYGLGSKFLGLAQTFVGFAVGLHYYVTVFHRVVLRQPPRTNWKIHGIYATCFLLICMLARAERRKKAYVEDGGGEGKKN